MGEHPSRTPFPDPVYRRGRPGPRPGPGVRPDGRRQPARWRSLGTDGPPCRPPIPATTSRSSSPPPTAGSRAVAAWRPVSGCSSARPNSWWRPRGAPSRSSTSPGRPERRRPPSTSTSRTWRRPSRCWPRSWSRGPGSSAETGRRRLVRDASWDTAVAVVEGFMDYWERNRAVFRVVELTTVEGDLRFQGLRVRALNAVTVTLARVIATHAGSSGSAGRGRPDGRRRHTHRHARPGRRPPLRVRVLGHPHRLAGRQPGPAAPLVGHRVAPPPTGPGCPAPASPGTPHRAGGGRWCRLGPHRQGASRPRPPERRVPSTAPVSVGCGRRAVQRRATGLTGEPSPPVKRQWGGVEQERVPTVRRAGVGQFVEEPVLALGHAHLDQVEEVHGQEEVVRLARDRPRGPWCRWPRRPRHGRGTIRPWPW